MITTDITDGLKKDLGISKTEIKDIPLNELSAKDGTIPIIKLDLNLTSLAALCLKMVLFFRNS